MSNKKKDLNSEESSADDDEEIVSKVLTDLNLVASSTGTLYRRTKGGDLTRLSK